MKILGLSGKMGTGKSTIANLIVENYGEGAKRRAFGDALKEEVSNEFCFPLEWCYFQKDRVVNVRIKQLEPPVTIRRLLQYWGTEYRRAQDPEYWNIRMNEFIKNNEKKTKLLVIDDVRFRDEADFIKERGGYLIRLCPYRGYKHPEITHVSETELNSYTRFDLVILPAFGDLENVFEKMKKRLPGINPK